MARLYPRYIGVSIIVAYVLLFAASCSKDKKDDPGTGISNIAKIGLYQYGNTDGRRVFMPITKVGTVTTAYLSVFDTGSTGMTIDADGILPASMITSNGITVTGDSVIVNGITVTNQTAVMAYGNNVGGETREYGNLAYASVTMGDSNGSVTATRIPFFLYYKAVDMTNNTTLPTHSNDVFGVGPGYSYATNKIGSPLSYFPIPNGVTNGFRLAKLSSTAFNTTLTYVPGLLTIGLIDADLNAGFIMHNLSFSSQGGYSPNIPATINYNGSNVSALMLFDTGNPAINYVSNQASSANVTTLPANTTVSVTTTSGFTYQYVTNTTTNATQVVRPSYSGDPRTIYNINFFVDNQFLTDYQNHRIGLKN